MTPDNLMIASFIVLVVSFVGAVANLGRFMKSDSFDEGVGGFMTHAILGGLVSLSSIGLLGGFIWFLVLQIKG